MRRKKIKKPELKYTTIRTEVNIIPDSHSHQTVNDQVDAEMKLHLEKVDRMITGLNNPTLLYTSRILADGVYSVTVTFITHIEYEDQA